MLNLASLNPQQRQAVITHRGPVLILAGAGTGKTRVITFRIAHLIETGVQPGHILAVTFTNKAAREMQERVSKLIPRRRSKEDPSEKENKPTICTFHSLCVRILRLHIEKLGYKRNFVIYDESEQLGTVKKILSHLNTRGEKIEPGAILSGLSRLKNSGLDAMRATGDHADAIGIAAHIRPKYESALRACNAVDFDDLILLTLKLFREHPSALQACQEKYRYVMVDEYQDTNASQFQLIHHLTGEHRNLCVVGDDDQSIYGWRGADLSNLLDMEKQFPDVKVVKLEQNYRSTNTILTAANAVIKKNTLRRGKQLWSDKGQGPRIALYTYKNDEEEAQGIVERIEFLRLTQRIPWSDQAILFRTNAQTRPLEIALRASNVRYHIIGGQSFFDRREVRDFLAYSKAFVNPHDDISLLRIANVPARGLSDVTMERLLTASQERKCSVYGVMKNPAVTTTFLSKTRESIEQFVELIERTRGILQTESLSRDPGLLQGWAERFLAETGYLDELRRLEKNPEMGEARVRNLKDLICSMDGQDPTIPPVDRLENFLSEVTLDNQRNQEEEVASNSVTLITMHSCKGLEFPHVYIAGMEDGLLPHERSKVENTLDEERRLFYVAITRAMQTLTITHSGGRKKYGKLVTARPSPFLKDLPAELVEHADEKAAAPVKAEAGKSLFDAMRAACG
jgi:superfamily I DNA/RNA helicase